MRVGGDKGAIAAMTGALAGAYLGQSAIPWSCRRALEGALRLVNIADKLLAFALSKEKRVA